MGGRRRKLGGAVLTSSALCVPVSAHADWWSWLFGPKDYEDCAENAAKEAKSKEALNILLSACDSKFGGRRKPTGGYTFYDSRQNRYFDIAGPNPTRAEGAFIEKQYSYYVAAQAELEKLRQEESQRQEAEAERQAALRRTAAQQAAIAQAEQDRKLQLAQANLERRRQAALSKIAVISTNMVCLYPSLPGCGSYKLTATIKNQSPESISMLAVGWVFMSEGAGCPTFVQTKHQEQVRLRPGDSIVMNIDSGLRSDGPASKEFRYCVKVTDAQIMP